MDDTEPIDPYLWLEEVHGERALAWVRARNAEARQVLEARPEFAQIRETLDPQRVPPIHVETAIKQNRGVLNIIENTVRPHLDKLNEPDRQRLLNAISATEKSVEEHQQLLEKRTKGKN